MNSHQRRKSRRRGEACARTDAHVDMALAYHAEYGRIPVTREEWRDAALLLIASVNARRTYEEEIAAIYGIDIEALTAPPNECEAFALLLYGEFERTFPKR